MKPLGSPRSAEVAGAVPAAGSDGPGGTTVSPGVRATGGAPMLQRRPTAQLPTGTARQTRRTWLALATTGLVGAGSAVVSGCGYPPVDGIAPARSYRAPRPAKLTVQLDGTWETHRALRKKLF